MFQRPHIQICKFFPCSAAQCASSRPRQAPEQPQLNHRLPGYHQRCSYSSRVSQCLHLAAPLQPRPLQRPPLLLSDSRHHRRHRCTGCSTCRKSSQSTQVPPAAPPVGRCLVAGAADGAAARRAAVPLRSAKQCSCIHAMVPAQRQGAISPLPGSPAWAGSRQMRHKGWSPAMGRNGEEGVRVSGR